MNEVLAASVPAVRNHLRAELNNNQKMKSEVFVKQVIECGSSASSSSSSDDTEIASLHDSIADANHHQDNPTEEEKPDVRRFRSMSDGSPLPGTDGEPFVVFPSLPDAVLEKMGLLGEHVREKLTDEEMENKFVALSLAVSTDSATIKDRFERQRRCRDQTETNLNGEIEELIKKVHDLQFLLQPLYINSETTERIAALLDQVDIIVKATVYAAIAEGRFGAVQHEQRLAESVQLMINHVNVLKEQRDSARRQLEYTKRVLQDTSSNVVGMQSIKQKNTFNGRVMTKRRASVADITRSRQDNPTKGTNLPDFGGRLVRRPSELAMRGNTLVRSTRSTRLDFGVDLMKIREGAGEDAQSCTTEEENETDNNTCHSDEDAAATIASANSSRKCSLASEPDMSTQPLRTKISHRFKQIAHCVRSRYQEWLNSTTPSELLCLCALMCFSLGVIAMGNVLVELECAKRGISVPFYFWNLSVLCSSEPVTNASQSFSTVT